LPKLPKSGKRAPQIQQPRRYGSGTEIFSLWPWWSRMYCKSKYRVRDWAADSENYCWTYSDQPTGYREPAREAALGFYGRFGRDEWEGSDYYPHTLRCVAWLWIWKAISCSALTYWLRLCFVFISFQWRNPSLASIKTGRNDVWRQNNLKSEQGERCKIEGNFPGSTRAIAYLNYTTCNTNPKEMFCQFLDYQNAYSCKQAHQAW
jgi:hypothetical protein